MTTAGTGPGIGRDPEAAARQLFDLIIVGGGIHGIMLALEASRRRLRPLLLERADFGGGLSSGALRLLHDDPPSLSSWLRSPAGADERIWWWRHFPVQLKPMPVVRPLRSGEHPPAAELLGRLERQLRRLRGDDGSPEFSDPRALSADELRHACPTFDRADLTGGLTWTGLAITTPARLCLEALRWARMTGATALNYMEVTEIVVIDGAVAGVEARDLVRSNSLRFQAPIVVTAAGPWTFDLLGRSTVAELPHVPAWSALIDRALSPTAAVAWRPGAADRTTCYVVPIGQASLIGPVVAGEHPGGWPDWRKVELILERLRTLMPGLDIEQTEVLRLSSFKMPRAALLGGRNEATVVDAAGRHGPSGLYALVGGQITDSRRTADRLLRLAFPAQKAEPYATFRPPRLGFSADDVAVRGWLRGQSLTQLARIAAEESVIHLDDLILRRTPLADRPREALQIAEEACRLLRYDGQRRRNELERLRQALAPPQRRPPAWLRPAERVLCSPLDATVPSF